ncbi:transporter [Bacillus stercoris]|uniref:transporter n=1 Tax=Bacillus stercoris TaxID=2054641 RepID=UPI000D4BF28C|nr:transporter [Bacillus subtilis]
MLSGVLLKEPFELVVIGSIFVTVIKKKQPDAYPAAERRCSLSRSDGFFSL